MFEFEKLRGNTYRICMPTNIGVYDTGNGEVLLIDTGLNDRSAQRILSLLEKMNMRVKAVILTHAHTDHAGGGKYIAEQTGCDVYASEAERIFVENPDLEPAVVYGAFPCRDFRVKFMNTPKYRVRDLRELDAPEGMEFFPLPGHFAGMVGVKTPDDVYFVADSVNAQKTLETAKICYLFDVEAQFETLEWIKCLDGKLCVPSHAEPTLEIGKLADINREHLLWLNDYILKSLATAMTIEELTVKMSRDFELVDTYAQYVLTLSEVRTHLTYLRHHSLVNFRFEDKRMLWEKA